MNVKIIGSNCKNGMQLYKVVNRAATEQESDIEIERLDDKKGCVKIWCKKYSWFSCK